ncbi:hypothetical protein [Arsenicicoccus sp. oral taxon 190]|uniref:hypothetical protein n=1 Tax=Arsenicicoccus sp. oral taxon 190 TaxID=1658671 RepID=UPI0012E23526|nr:hypothetical protein [Arsenicicoccus sp. oral taxon 190]
MLVSYGCAPLGLALIAPAMGAWGVTPVLLGCAAACLLGAALAAVPRTSRTLSTPGGRAPATPVVSRR